MIETRPARFADALALAPELRLEDAAEIRASWGLETLEGLFVCLLMSEGAFTLARDERVLALWGVGGVSWQGLAVGQPWMLASQRLFEHQRELARRSRVWVERLLLDYDVLTNVTSASNGAHLRWLAWCGFRGLRVHRSYGVSRRPFCEFYRVNRLRHPQDAGVRDALLHRTPAMLPTPDSRLTDIARYGIAILRAGAAAAPPLLAEMLPACDEGGARQRAGVIRLLMEIARHVTWAMDGGRAAASAIEAWCENMVAVQEVCSLEGGQDPVSVLQRLAADRPAPRSGGATVGPRREAAMGMAAVAALARHAVDRLTLGGRVSRVHGRRLRCAALGMGDPEALLPEGVSTAALSELWTEQRVVRDPEGREASSRRHAWPNTAELLFRRLEGCCLPGLLEGHLAQALEPVTLALPGSSGLGLPEVISSISAVADRVSRGLLPGPRLGGVVGGLLERHALYRLLRARLLQAAVPSVALWVLERDVAALLTAGEFEASLLRRGGAFVDDDLVDLVRCVHAILGPGTLGSGDDLPGALTLLLPALSVPAAHALQLTPALLAWHQVAGGELEAGLAALSELFGEDPNQRQRACSRLLRGMTRNLGIVAIRSRLEDETTRALRRRRPSTRPPGGAASRGAGPSPALRSGPAAGEPVGAAGGGP